MNSIRRVIHVHLGYTIPHPTSTMSLAGKNIHIGVVLFPQYQLLDIAGPIDYINSHSHIFCSFFKNNSLIPKATTIH